MDRPTNSFTLYPILGLTLQIQQPGPHASLLQQPLPTPVTQSHWRLFQTVIHIRMFTINSKSNTNYIILYVALHKATVDSRICSHSHTSAATMTVR